MKMQERIESKVKAFYLPAHLELLNESHRHNVPAASETHFKLTLVSAAFQGKANLERHRGVYALLEEELKNGVHALSLHLFTPEEWKLQNRTAPSPVCQGGE